MSTGSVELLLAQHRAQQFLFREARLMDERSYDAWESLWTDDCVYWIPANGEDTDPLQDVSILYDNRARLGKRIARLKSDKAHSQDPPARLLRVISNVEVNVERPAEGRAEPDSPTPLWTVYSNFHLSESRLDVRVDWAGRVTHHLRPDGDGFRMAFKKVVLVNNDQELTNLDFLL